MARHQHASARRQESDDGEQLSMRELANSLNGIRVAHSIMANTLL